MGARAGEWLDHVVDATKVSVLHAVVLISFYRFTDASDLQLLVRARLSSGRFGVLLRDDPDRPVPAGRAVDDPAVTALDGNELLQTAVALPTDYAVLCLSFALLGWQRGFRVVYSTCSC